MENEKIDRRRHYVLVLDTETANTLRTEDGQLDTASALVYDCGWSVVDTSANVYVERSFVNTDVYDKMADLMKSAYYGWKRPLYEAGIEMGERQKANTYEIRQAMLADIAKYGIKEVVAHNARFDINALNSTLRWTTKSKFRYWMPFDIVVWDTMKMARSVIHKMPTYRKFCEKHEMLTASGRLPTTAEALYKFISRNPNFRESHTGLEDVQIERSIMFYCYRQHRKMDKVLYGARSFDRPTEMQNKIMKIVKNH